MVKEKYITVPKNEAGMADYAAGREGTENMEEFILPEKEFETLDRHRVFDIINEKCDLMIDIYESEKVTADQLKKVNREIRPIKGTWTEAVDRAIKYNTCVFLDF